MKDTKLILHSMQLFLFLGNKLLCFRFLTTQNLNEKPMSLNSNATAYVCILKIYVDYRM